MTDEMTVETALANLRSASRNFALDSENLERFEGVAFRRLLSSLGKDVWNEERGAKAKRNVAILVLREAIRSLESAVALETVTENFSLDGSLLRNFGLVPSSFGKDSLS